MPTATPFNNLITFSRGSNATVTGSNGLIQWAPNNLLTFSEQFDNAAWTKTDATIYANQDFANGVTGPELVTNPGPFTSGTGYLTFQSNISTSAGNLIATATVANDTRVAVQVATVSGRYYRLTVQVVSSDASTVFVGANFTSGAVSFTQSTVGTSAASGEIALVVLATNTTLNLVLRNTGLAIGQTFSVSSVSAKELTPVAATAPDDTQTADTAVPSGATPIVRQTFTTSAAGPYTASVWLRSATNTNVTISLRPTGAGSPVSVVCAVTPTWQRFTVSLTAVTGVSNIQFWIEQFSQAILIWGAQLELGSAATTYNPTTVKNLLGFSEAFDNAAWGKGNSSIVTGAQANPVNGAFNAQKLMENTATGTHRVQQGFTSLTGTTYTFSCYAKAAERTWIYLYDDMANGYAFFNLANGTVGTVAAGWTSTSITSVGNGWYRISGTTTEAAGGVGGQLIGIASANNTPSYTGDGNSGVYIYGAQLSDSASLDPYVPTPGAAPSSTAFYGPRFDFDPVTLQPRGLLVEEQRTNLATFSDQFNDAIWTKTRSSVSVNTTAAPDGTTTADTLVEDTTASNTHILNRILGNPLAAATYTYSIYAKPAGRRYIQLILIVDPASTNVRYAVMFDLQTGAVTTTSTASSPTATANAIQAAGNGWYRCVISIGNPSGLRVDVSHALSDTPTSPASALAPIYTGDGVSGAFIWGAQLEAGAFATSYIPTVASTVTRSADVATISGSLFSQWYGQSEGSFVTDADSAKNSGNPYGIFVASDGTSNNRVATVSNDTGTRALGFVVSGGSTVAEMVALGSTTANTPYKMAVAYKANDFAASGNGGTPATDTAGVVPVGVNRLDLGFFFPGSPSSNILNGHIRNIRFIPARAADFQLQGLST